MKWKEDRTLCRVGNVCMQGADSVLYNGRIHSCVCVIYPASGFFTGSHLN